MIIAVLCLVSNSEEAATLILPILWCCCYYDADDVMTLIDVVISLTQSLYHDLTHTSSLALLFFALSLSLSLTLVEITTSGSPSNDHCCSMTGKQFQLLLLLSYLLQSLSLVIFALTLSCSLSLSFHLDSWGHWTVHRIIIARLAIPMLIRMMMIGMLMTWWWWSMFFISLNPSLNRSLSFSLTCRFFRLLDSPSNDHCCPMSGKQFRGSCYFDTADTLMLLLLWCRWRDDADRCCNLTHSIAVSWSHSH